MQRFLSNSLDELLYSRQAITNETEVSHGTCAVTPEQLGLRLFAAAAQHVPGYQKFIDDNCDGKAAVITELCQIPYTTKANYYHKYPLAGGNDGTASGHEMATRCTRSRSAAVLQAGRPHSDCTTAFSPHPLVTCLWYFCEYLPNRSCHQCMATACQPF